MLPHVSNTFHGRDIFAPTAAHIANKTNLRKIGKKIQGILTPNFAKIVKEKGKVIGEIIHIDDFGNVITNIDTDCLKLAKSHCVFVLRAKGKELRLRVRKNYVDIQRHQIAGIIGGHGFLEISMNQDNAAKRLGVRTGDAIALFSTTEKNHIVPG
jgi:S-adenosylmethionine hydrolase